MAARAVLPFGILSNVMKQREKCVKAATALIEEGTSVVVGTFYRHPALSTWLRISTCVLKASRQHECRSRCTRRMGKSSEETLDTYSLRTLYSVG